MIELSWTAFRQSVEAMISGVCAATPGRASRADADVADDPSGRNTLGAGVAFGTAVLGVAM